MSLTPQVEQWVYKGMRATVTRDQHGKITIKIEKMRGEKVTATLLTSTTESQWAVAITTAQEFMNSAV